MLAPVALVWLGWMFTASWDIVQWDDFLAGDLSAVVEARLERRHYACLALALGPALLAALAGPLIHFQIRFGILVVVVLLMLVTLDRVWRLVK